MTDPREWALNAGQGLGGTGDKGKVEDKRDEGNVCLYYSSLKKQSLRKGNQVFKTQCVPAKYSLL